MCLAVVCIKPFSIHCIPDEFKTYGLCLYAVTNNGFAINYVPEEHKDYNMYLVASISWNGTMFYMPPKYQTFELLLKIPDVNYIEYINWDILTQSQQEFIRLKYGI